MLSSTDAGCLAPSEAATACWIRSTELDHNITFAAAQRDTVQTSTEQICAPIVSRYMYKMLNAGMPRAAGSSFPSLLSPHELGEATEFGE